MKNLLVGVLMLFPISLFAIGLPSLSIPGTSSSDKFFGGKIEEVGSCFCPTQEPQKIGFKWLKYGIFWDGATKTEESLFYKPFSTNFYAYGQIGENIWHLGKYTAESDSCKYMTEADYAEAVASLGTTINCSGSYDADGTIIYAGTSPASLGLNIPGI